ncbi:Uncharacterised protein [Chlamydia trachomatis]|nr:Uncharacterised protein [Chlamydia trachomatis]
MDEVANINKMCPLSTSKSTPCLFHWTRSLLVCYLTLLNLPKIDCNITHNSRVVLENEFSDGKIVSNIIRQIKYILYTKTQNFYEKSSNIFSLSNNYQVMIDLLQVNVLLR